MTPEHFHVLAEEIYHHSRLYLLCRSERQPGNSADPAELYRRFRGRDPGVEPLLAGRGLLSAG